MIYYNAEIGERAWGHDGRLRHAGHDAAAGGAALGLLQLHSGLTPRLGVRFLYRCWLGAP